MSCMLSFVAVQSTKIFILDCRSKRESREGRGCVCLALPVGLVSLQQLSISMSLLACVGLADDCRVNNGASVCLASGSIRKKWQCAAHNWTI